MVAVWIVTVVAGLAVAILASQGAVRHASALAFGSRVPPFIIGITLVAIGTDLPEIANSFIASASGHGDLNVGDSVGSAATQATLVLGLIPFLAASVSIAKRSVVAAGGFTVLALGVLAVLVTDGYLGRRDGLLLVGLWALMSAGVWRFSGSTEPALSVRTGRKFHHAAWAILMLGVVGAGAAAAVWGFVELAALLDVPEYLIAFFATSIGTSLPELVVDVTAVRRGARDMAIGDIFGSSLVDATLSVGIGPALFPTAVTAGLAVRGALVAAAAILIVTVLLVRRGRHDWRTAVPILILYAGLYPILLL